jgi:hypothetical protein
METSLGEVGVSCLPFPVKSAPIDDYISWFGEEVKAMLGVVWQLNDNFVVLDIKGVLNMLHSSSCHELSGCAIWLHQLMLPSSTMFLQRCRR